MSASGAAVMSLDSLFSRASVQEAAALPSSSSARARFCARRSGSFAKYWSSVVPCVVFCAVGLLFLSHNLRLQPGRAFKAARC